MAYSRTQWRESETALSAENMNNIEDGIQEALAKANAIDSNTYRKTEVYRKEQTYNKDEVYTKAEVNTLVDGKLNGKIVISTTDPTAGQGGDGDIWFTVV